MYVRRCTTSEQCQPPKKKASRLLQIGRGDLVLTHKPSTFNHVNSSGFGGCGLPVLVTCTDTSVAGVAMNAKRAKAVYMAKVE